MLQTVYTREELVSICEQSIVQEKDWSNRDSRQSIGQVGELWALLKAGCVYRICTEPTDEPCKTSVHTIWIEVTSDGFNYFEEGPQRVDIFWLPTLARLEARVGKDWYH